MRFNEVAQEPPQFKAFARKAVGLEDAGKRRAKDLKLASMLPSSALRARPGQEKKAKAPKPAPARQVSIKCKGADFPRRPHSFSPSQRPYCTDPFFSF